jgi:hypothetical protein
MKHAKLSEKWKRMAVLQMFAHTMLLSEDFSRTTMHQGQNSDASTAEQLILFMLISELRNESWLILL